MPSLLSSRFTVARPLPPFAAELPKGYDRIHFTRPSLHTLWARDATSSNTQFSVSGSSPVAAEQLQYGHSADVTAFLRENPDIDELLKEAEGRVSGLFGINARISLSVITDPEAPEDHRILLARISSQHEISEAAQLLDKLDYEWWLDVQPRVTGRLILDLSF